MHVIHEYLRLGLYSFGSLLHPDITVIATKPTLSSKENSRGFKDEPHEIKIAYYPTNTDIRNHIDAAKAPIQISKFDQVNLKAMVDEWSEFKKAGRYFSVLS